MDDRIATGGTLEAERRNEAMPIYRGPIYEPKESRLRPWSLTTLFAFFFGRFLGRFFSKARKQHHVATKHKV